MMFSEQSPMHRGLLLFYFVRDGNEYEIDGFEGNRTENRTAAK